MPVRLCPGCGQFYPGSRCTDCKPRSGSTRAYRTTRAQILTPGACCYLCGDPATEVDHVIPRMRGGTDDPSNLAPCCEACNRRKRGH